jgi:hypothetical protein
MMEPKPCIPRPASFRSSPPPAEDDDMYCCDVVIRVGWIGTGPERDRACWFAELGIESHTVEMLVTDVSRLFGPPLAPAVMPAGIGKSGAPCSVHVGRRGPSSCSRVFTELPVTVERNCVARLASPGGATIPDTRKASMLSSLMPCLLRRVRSFLFSSATLRAAT